MGGRAVCGEHQAGVGADTTCSRPKGGCWPLARGQASLCVPAAGRVGVGATKVPVQGQEGLPVAE